MFERLFEIGAVGVYVRIMSIYGTGYQGGGHHSDDISVTVI